MCCRTYILYYVLILTFVSLLLTTTQYERHNAVKTDERQKQYIPSFGKKAGKIAMRPQLMGDTPPEEVFSKDFGALLQGLGSIVDKYKNKEEAEEVTHHRHVNLYTTESLRTNGRYYEVSKTDKDVFRDLLMMKLVSYYENKYKITHDKPLTMHTTVSEGRNLKDLPSITNTPVVPTGTTYGANYQTQPATDAVVEVVVL